MVSFVCPTARTDYKSLLNEVYGFGVSEHDIGILFDLPEAGRPKEL
ncbi:MAG: hypothetical protein IJP89_06300 [Synergistaceae bacterium]|nr:hypothetical protein [Synergistaceae bacterium]MBR0150954.1 hypothetical protein [Synergistaceae bacterium]